MLTFFSHYDNVFYKIFAWCLFLLQIPTISIIITQGGSYFMKYMTAEPFRIKMVEPITRSTKAQRQQWLQEAGYNAFRLKSEQVYIDCITDSGTSAMSQAQWSAMMMGDEAYAGCRSFYRLEASVQDIFGMPYVQPTHQGRAADYIMTQIYCRPGAYAIGNMHFDTFRGNAEMMGCLPVDYAIDEGENFAELAASVLWKTNRISLAGGSNLYLAKSGTYASFRFAPTAYLPHDWQIGLQAIYFTVNSPRRVLTGVPVYGCLSVNKQFGKKWNLGIDWHDMIDALCSDAKVNRHAANIKLQYRF